jgi:uncharacterized membrane protein YphA (DoxX/SURF4 family)
MNPSKPQRIIGWVLTGLLALFFLAGATFGIFFMPQEMIDEMQTKLGVPHKTMIVIDVIEVICVVLFVIPRTAFWGAILLTGFLGGAVFAHVHMGDSFAMALIVGAIVWVALGLRSPVIFRLAAGKW